MTRRVIRILGRIGAAGSLLLGIGAAVLWVRSYWKTDGWGRYPYFVDSNEYRQDRIQLSRGEAQVDLRRFQIDAGFVGRMRLQRAKGAYSDKWERDTLISRWRPAKKHWWEGLGLYVRSEKPYSDDTVPGTGSWVFVAVPYWVLLVVFLIWPGGWIVGWSRRRRRFGEGRCRNCGYDLRETPEKCPECGVFVVGEVGR